MLSALIICFDVNNTKNNKRYDIDKWLISTTYTCFYDYV